MNTNWLALQYLETISQLSLTYLASHLGKKKVHTRAKFSKACHPSDAAHKGLRMRIYPFHRKLVQDSFDADIILPWCVGCKKDEPTGEN